MAADTLLPAPERPGPLPLPLLPAGPKLLAAGVYAVGVSLISHPVPALLACLPPVALVLLAKIPVKAVLMRLLPVNVFFLACWLLLPLGLAAARPPDFTGLELGPVSVSASGLRLAALITLKGNAIAATLLLLAGTSPVTASCRALLRIRVPEKLVALLLLTYAHLSLTAEEAARVFAAARLRGFRPGLKPKALRAVGYLAAMILLRSWQRAVRVNRAMRLRGFNGRFPLLDPGADAPRPRETRMAYLLVLFFALYTLYLAFPHWNAGFPALP